MEFDTSISSRVSQYAKLGAWRVYSEDLRQRAETLAGRWTPLSTVTWRSMMDPAIASLAANVVAVLMPIVTTGAEEVVRAVGDAAYEKAKGLLSSLKARWAGDEEAADTLKRFEEKPE